MAPIRSTSGSIPRIPTNVFLGSTSNANTSLPSNSTTGTPQSTGNGQFGQQLTAALNSFANVLKKVADVLGGPKSQSGGGQQGGGGAPAKSSGGGAPDKASGAGQGGTDDAYAQRVLQLVNQERQKRGLQPLKMSPELMQAAKQHSAAMAQSGQMTHDGLSDGPFAGRIQGFGKSAENVAQGQQSPEQVVNEWMNSPGHRKNILDPNLKYMGLAQQNGFWTQDFGG